MAGARGALIRVPRARLAGLALCVSAAASCVSFSFRRATRETPIQDAELELLAPGRTEIGEVLDRFGAPLFVWEYKGDGAALAYGALRDHERGIRVSVPVANEFSASFDYSESDARLRGIVFLFDESGTLEQWRRGLLADIRAETSPRRPAPVVEAEP